jgi:colanic acid/amylovoran biosynthesis glycosyltransferase
MGTTCIINGHRRLISETFIAAHLERLTGDKVVLYNYFPEYTFNGRMLRYRYSRRPILSKLKRLMPQFLYDRLVTRNEQSFERTMDFMTGFVREHNVDVFLAEYGFNGADITPVARALGLPLVVHFHGHDAHNETALAPYRDKLREMFAYAETVVSVSHTMTKNLIKLGANPDRVVYNPYGAREYFFDVQPDYSPVLLAVGRFADIKAPYLTLMAFAKAVAEVPNASLIMVGEGPLLETCKNLATVWKIDSQVSFPGAVSHDGILPLMERACAFVQHSITTSERDMEGMPNSILEAGAAGLPVISTRHAGIINAVIEGETGFLVDERDVDGMARHMACLLKNLSTCRRMGEGARRHIRAEYSIDRHIQCLQMVIDRVRRSAKG